MANTAKRAFLITLSILLFGNPITLLSGLGTVFVITGVFLYIKAQQYDSMRKNNLSPKLKFTKNVRAI